MFTPFNKLRKRSHPSPKVADWRRIRFTEVELEYDCTATAALYPYRGCNMWCQCCGCTNFQRAMEEHFPPNTASALRELCIDPFEPLYTTRNRLGSIPSGFVRYT